MSSTTVAVSKRKTLSDLLDGNVTSSGSKKATTAADDSDDEEDRLRQDRMREVMQQTTSMQPTTQPADAADSTASSAPCTHSCPRCCPRAVNSARRVTFPFIEGEWLLRPVGGRVAHAATSRGAGHRQPPDALPTSYDSSIATVARSRLQAYLSRQLEVEQHVWPDSADGQADEEEDTMDWTRLVAGSVRPAATADKADNTQQAAAEAAAVAEAATSRERRKLKRKQERQALTAAQQSADTNET